MQNALNRTYVVLALILLAAASFRLLWPQDTSFLIDQTKLIDRALQDNATGSATVYGLEGSKRLFYGPFAIWFYRGLLHLSQDMVTVVLARILIVTGITAIALFWLASLCGFLLPVVAVVPLLSPYLWYYARDPWDNSLMIPLVALALASYLAFHRDKKAWQLGITSLCLTACFLTHLMSLPLTGAIALHFLIYHRDWPLKNKAGAAAVAALSLAMAWPYLVYLMKTPRESVALGGMLAPVGFSLCGAVQFTAIGFERFLGKAWFTSPGAPWLANALSTLSMATTGLAYLFCWYGIYLAARSVVAKRALATADMKFTACFIAVVGLVFHFGLNFAMRLFSYPHYYNGVWILFFFFLWLGVTRLWHFRWARAGFAGYVGCLAACLVHIAVQLHLNGGSRELSYGPTLGNLIQVARELNRYEPGRSFVSEAKHPRIFPSMITTLQKLYPAAPSEKTTASLSTPIVIRYENPDNKRDGRIELVRPD